MDYTNAVERASTPGALVWHYTSLDTLSRILESNCLLATEVAFQNDIRETVTADEAFDEAVDQLEETPEYAAFAHSVRNFMEDIDGGVPRGGRHSNEGTLLDRARFIICASEDPDSLYAWRTYASNGIGCAIGLDPNIPLGVVHPTDTPSFHRVHHWRNVVYSADEVREEALRLLMELGEQWRRVGARDDDEDLRSFDLQDLVFRAEDARSRVRAIAKDPSFSDEHELRLTVPGVRLTTSLVSTPSSMGPRPHLRVATSSAWGRPVPDTRSAPLLPVRAVRLAPNAPDIAVDSVRWLLLGHGYQIDANPVDPVEAGEYSWAESVVVTTSRHPYRSG